jgi:hypothetical protein
VEWLCLGHKHELKKTHVCFVEYDDVNFERLGDARYFGEGNSKNRKLEFVFEYCLGCDLRLLNGHPVMTRDILEEEFEKYAKNTKKGNCKANVEVTLQHSDFEVLQRLIGMALELGKQKSKV